MANHYRHSGRAPLGGTIAALVQTGLIAALCGIAYTLIAHYILFLIVLVALPPVLGLLLAQWVGYSAKARKIRNLAVVRIVALATGVIALYVAWGTTIYGMVASEDLPQALLDMQWRPYLPQNIAGIAQHLFEKGFFIVHEGEEPLRGWLLASLWILEAAIIIGVPLFFAERFIAREVFCERCDQWLTPRVINRLYASGAERQWSAINQGQLQRLDELPRTEPGVRPVVELSVHVCPHCAESAYLTATAKTAAANGQSTEKVLVDRLEIVPAAVEAVMLAGCEPEPEEDWPEDYAEDSDDSDDD